MDFAKCAPRHVHRPWLHVGRPARPGGHEPLLRALPRAGGGRHTCNSNEHRVEHRVEHMVERPNRVTYHAATRRLRQRRAVHSPRVPWHHGASHELILQLRAAAAVVCARGEGAVKNIEPQCDWLHRWIAYPFATTIE